MRKVLKKQKTNIIFIVILIAFVFLLSSIPSWVNKSSSLTNQYNFNYEKDDPYEQSKFEHISKTVLEKITLTKINSVNLPYINKLIYEDKIINRDHTLGQEIIAQYLKGNYNITQKLAQDFIETNLNEFETQKERLWRNHRLILEHEGKENIIYTQEKVLINPLNARAIGISSQIISPYEFQIYTFKFEDGTNKSITLNLNTNEGEEELAKYINFETNEQIQKFKSLESKFINSNDRFELRFMVWK